MENQHKNGQKIEKIDIICQLKRQRNPFYPYYIIADGFSDSKIHFLGIIQYKEQSILILIPFNKDTNSKEDKSYTKLASHAIPLDELPPKGICGFKILNLQYSQISYGVRIQKLDFILGYRAGYLLLLSYSYKNGKKTQIKERINQLKAKQSFLSRATNYLFSNDEFYKTWIKGSYKQFTAQPRQTIYCIGRTVVITKKLCEATDTHIQNIYQSIPWQSNNLFQKSNNTLLQYSSNRYHGFKQKQSILIESKMQMFGYEVYNDKNQSPELLFISNQTSIIIIQLSTLLTMQQIILQQSIKSFKIIQKVQSQIPLLRLIIMPYDDVIYILEFIDSTLVRYSQLKGHRSFVSNTLIVDQTIITIGLDNRICITKIQDIQKWVLMSKQNLSIQQNQKQQKVIIEQNQSKNFKKQLQNLKNYNQQSQQLEEQNNLKIKKKQIVKYNKLTRGWQSALANQLHSIIKINNNLALNNSTNIFFIGEKGSRNNLCDYGFGNALLLKQIICCFNYDGKIKVFGYNL